MGSLCLVDGDGAGAGAGADGWAAAVDCSGDVVSVKVALHHDGPIGVDGAGAGFSVEVEVGVWGDLEADAAGATFGAPLGGGVAAGPRWSRSRIAARRPPMTPSMWMEPEPVWALTSPGAVTESSMLPDPVWTKAAPWTLVALMRPEPVSMRESAPMLSVWMEPEPEPALTVPRCRRFRHAPEPVWAFSVVARAW